MYLRSYCTKRIDTNFRSGKADIRPKARKGMLLEKVF